MEKKKIAKLQIFVGIILFLITLIGSFLIIKNVYLDSWVEGIEEVTKVYAEENGLTDSLTANIILQGQIIKGMMYIFGVCSLILLTLSVFLILQGIFNLSKK